MKINKIFIPIISLIFLSIIFSQDSIPIKNRAWYVPDYVKAQFAGNIGFFSVGIGYQTFHNHVHSELLYGYVPASISKAKQINIITIKNTLPLHTKNLKRVTLSPVTGLAVSFETGNNSFLLLPNKYPKGYYYTNAFHFTFFVGPSIHRNFNNLNIIKGASLYFELGTVDTYLWYAITSKEVELYNIFSSAIGLNLFL